MFRVPSRRPGPDPAPAPRARPDLPGHLAAGDRQARARRADRRRRAARARRGDGDRPGRDRGPLRHRPGEHLPRRHIDALQAEAVFAAELKPGVEAVLSDEHDEQRWLTPGEASEMVVWPAYREAIAQIEWIADASRPGARHAGRRVGGPGVRAAASGTAGDPEPVDSAHEWSRCRVDRAGRRDEPRQDPAELPLEGRPPPTDLRLRGRLARARRRDDRAERRPARPDLLRHRARASRSSPRRWTPSSTRRSPARSGGSAASPCSTSRGSRRATTTRRRSSSGSRPRHDDEVQTVLSEAYAPPIREDLVAAPDRGDPRRGLEGGRRGDARRRHGAGARSAPSTARTCSSSSRRSARRATSRPTTTRSRSASSPGSCPFPSPSATRRAPRPPTS